MGQDTPDACVVDDIAVPNAQRFFKVKAVQNAQRFFKVKVDQRARFCSDPVSRAGRESRGYCCGVSAARTRSTAWSDHSGCPPRPAM